MSTPILIIGPSGSGKSTSLRNLNPDETLLIQSLKKPLPFKSTKWKPWDGEKKTGSIFVTDKSKHIVKIIQKAKENGKNKIVIDDFQYQMANEFMRRANEKQFQKFTDIGKNAWDIVQAVIEADDDLRVYILSHTTQDEYGDNIKMKTIGKLLDDKIVMEGMFSIVLRSEVTDGDYHFRTHNNGNDTVKTPLGMFESDEVENDLQMIDDAICEYYEIKTIEELHETIEKLKENIDDKDLLSTINATVKKYKDNYGKLVSIIKKLQKK